ncbi:MAG: LLM class flavin-dependent oxidoreductase [Chloroflexota bacterium]|nr:LLM class flavin-dependent oxidoreductase [Chloroflexota bacterium]
MEFGIFYQLPCADDQSPAERYADTISQAQLADQLGFDSVWLAEVHFNPRFSVLPAPLLLGSAIAQTTKQLKIATAVNLMPLHHPVRLAEEFATLDVISHGRAILGTGRGAMLRQYQGYGVDVEEGRERFVEGLDMVLEAWKSDELNYEGKYYQVSGVRVVPKPYQQPHPPVYIASNSNDTFTLVGELGHNILIAPIVVSLEGAKAGLDEYRHELKAHGHDCSAKRVNVNVLVHTTKDEDGSSTQGFEGSVRNYLSNLQVNRSRVVTGRVRDLSYEHVSTELSAIGSPERVIDKLESIIELLGADEIMCWFATGGLVPNEDVHASMRLFAEEVIPHFK